MSAQPEYETLNLSVAGIVLNLELPGPAALALRPRYDGFFTEQTGISLHASTMMAEDIEDPRIVYCEKRGDGFRLYSRSKMEAEIHESKSCGTIRYVECNYDAQRGYPAHLHSCLRATIATLLARQDGFLLHASAVTTPNGAIIFAGQSGAGKSTAASMFEPNDILNDDLVAVRKNGDSFSVWATPFTSTEGLPTIERSATLAAGSCLKKSSGIAMPRTDSAKALSTIVQSLTLPAGDRQLEANAFARAGELAECLPWFELSFFKNPDLVRKKVHETMAMSQ